VAAGAGLLGLAVAGGVRWADATAAPEPVEVRAVGPSPGDGSTDWVRLLSRLDLRRSAAFARGDPAVLDQVYLRGSAALKEDAAALATLSRRELTASGLRLEIRAAVPAAATGDRVVLRVVDRLAAYDLLDAAARVVERRPGRGARAWTVTLVPVVGAPGEWRIAAIRPAQ
jgi:hypothetical protein